MNRRAFFATLAAVAVSPLAARQPSAPEIIVHIRRRRQIAIWDFQRAVMEAMERDFWNPPMGLPCWIKKGQMT